MKQNIRDFIKNLISKREKSTIKQEDNDFTVSLFDKNSTSDYVEPFSFPTDEDYSKLQKEIEDRKEATISYLCMYPEPLIVRDIKNTKNLGILYPYDEYQYQPNNFDGYRNKNFFICRSKDIFDELYNDLQTNPNCSYSTYANNAIKNGDRPNSLSVMFMTNPLQDTRDEIASKLLNYLEVPTVYNKAVSVYDSTQKENCLAILSVDFMQNDYSFYSLSHRLTCGDTFETQLSKVQGQVDYINLLLAKEEKMTSIEIEQKKKDIGRDFAKSYIARNLILTNTDFDLKNVGIFLNKETHDIKLAPNFDLESCLGKRLVDSSPQLLYLPYLEKNYPEILTKLLQKTEKLLHKNIDGIAPLDTILNNPELFPENTFYDKEYIQNTIQNNLLIIKENLSPNFYKSDINEKTT